MAVRNGASVTIPVSLQVQMSEMAGQLEKVRKAFASVKPEAKGYKQLEGYLKSIEREFENIKRNAGETFTTHGQIDTFARRFERVKITAENFNEDLKKLDFSAFNESALNQDLIQQITDTKTQIDSLQQSLTNLAESSFRDLVLNSQEISEVLTRLKIDPEDFIEGKGFDAINTSTKQLTESIKELKKEQEKKEKDKNTESNKLNKQKEAVKNLENSYLELGIAAEEAAEARKKADEITSAIKNQRVPELKALSKVKTGLATDKKNFGTKTGRAAYGTAYFDEKGSFREGGKEALAKYLINSYNLTEKDLEEAGLEKITEASLSTLYTVLLEKVNIKIKNINEEIKKAETDLQQKTSQAETAQAKATSKEQELEQAQTEVSRIEAVVNNLQAEINALSQKAEDARTQIDQNNLALEKTEEFGRQVEETIASSDENVRIRELTLRVQELEEQLRQTIPAAQQASSGLEETAKTAEKMNLEARGMSESLKNSNEQLQRFNEIQNSIKQWFGFNEVINLTKNAIRDAISHIRELDDVMTEIAVVTDMTQQELWGQISTYSEMAQKYGATTQGVYEVSQLYYQQGLQTAEVMQLTEETLKMASIASIDYADATDYMTVAIRGFKLEMSDAQNVVDVYSNIAAVTASNTEELAVAMSKTASSAEAVGSSFENTTAMIALMVETTR